MTISIRGNTLRVDNKIVATIEDEDRLIRGLVNVVGGTEGVFIALSSLGKSRASSVAEFIEADKANVTKALERLLVDGRVKVVGVERGKKGRPSRIWTTV